MGHGCVAVPGRLAAGTSAGVSGRFRALKRGEIANNTIVLAGILLRA
jgi:hypothetical protein